MSTKLCWYHPESIGVPNELKCTNSTPVGESGYPECRSGCAMYQRCKRAFEYGDFPDCFWDMPSDFQNPPEDIGALRYLQRVIKNVESFVDNGINIYIHSPISGNGKTFRAVSIAKAYIRAKASGDRHSDKWVSYVHIPRLVSDYDIYDKMSFENADRQALLDKIHNLNSCKLVVWDDFGFNSGAYVESVILRSILAARISSGRSNIIVSSYSLDELKSSLSKGDYLRLKSSVLDIELKSPDFRFNEDVEFI